MPFPLKLIFQTPHNCRRIPSRPPRVSMPGDNADLAELRNAILTGHCPPDVQAAFNREYARFCVTWSQGRGHLPG